LAFSAAERFQTHHFFFSFFLRIKKVTTARHAHRGAVALVSVARVILTRVLRPFGGATRALAHCTRDL